MASHTPTQNSTVTPVTMNTLLTICLTLFLTNYSGSRGIEESCPLNNKDKSNRWYLDEDNDFLRNIAEDTLDKHLARDKYYEAVSKPLQNSCQIVKKIGGFWYGGCGFLDGEKIICMDLLFPAVKNKTCLVYR